MSVCKSRKDSALLQARSGGTHIADTWGIFWAALRSVALVWLSRSSAPLPTYGGLILPRGRFSPVVPFDYDCKHFFGASNTCVLR
jgi:hypothetical protein